MVGAAQSRRERGAPASSRRTRDGCALLELASLYETQAAQAQERADMLRAILVDPDPLPQTIETPEEPLDAPAIEH